MILYRHSVFTEAKKLLNITIPYILDGTFVKENFYILPYQKTSKNLRASSTVLMPEINYKHVLSDYLGKELNKNEFIQDINLKNSLVNELNNLKTFKTLSNKQLSKIKKETSDTLKKSINKAKKFIGYFKNKDFIINICPCRYGTWGSFTLFDPEKNEKKIEINLYPRIDCNIPSVVIELFSSSITRSLIRSNKNINWRETEAISDFFSAFVFENKNNKSTLDIVSIENTELRRKSLDFLIKTGLPVRGCLNYDSMENKIKLISKDISNNFAPYEFRFIKTLLENENKSVTYDKLSDCMYNTNSDIRFSMWGISKTAQRVKDKLEELGIPREIIQNIRGEGFRFLNNSSF
jgi:hypothetical protein